MKYLVLAVYHDAANNNVATHSKIMELGFKYPEDESDEIVNSLCESSGFGKDLIHEVFVFRSAQNFGTGPEQVAYWTAEDLNDDDDDDDEN